MSVTVSHAGFLTTVQDCGRRGFRKWGVSLGGALDSFALRVANALVGNDEDAAGLELTFGTVRLEFAEEKNVAWCGGDFNFEIEGELLSRGRAALVRHGEKLVATAPQNGARAWLALSGGIAVPKILGSRSTDLRGEFCGFEGRALRDGDELELRENPARANQLARPLRSTRFANWTSPNEWITRASVLRALPGDGAPEIFFREPFTVLPDSDRMGVRLKGPALELSDAGNLASEAVAPGTVQLPPSGDPILLLGDCQTIGGYPKIAHVIGVDLSIAAQLFPGASVRFHEVTLTEAHHLLARREEDFLRFKIGIAARLG